MQTYIVLILLFVVVAGTLWKWKCLEMAQQLARDDSQRQQLLAALIKQMQRSSLRDLPVLLPVLLPILRVFRGQDPEVKADDPRLPQLPSPPTSDAKLPNESAGKAQIPPPPHPVQD